ncbi:MAG: serine hydrolase [bacterium]
MSHHHITENVLEKKPRASSWIPCILCFLIGLAVFPLIQYFTPSATQKIYPLRESSLNKTNYKFVDPLLGLTIPDNFSSKQYVALQQSINSFVHDEVQKNNLETASVYFRDEKTAAGFSINSSEKYSPASLLKVPIMTVYYKLAEENPAILNQEIVYNENTDLNAQENILSPIQLQKGQKYSIGELIEHMIKYSDNNAATLLVQHLNNLSSYDYQGQFFKSLGINEIDIGKDFITINAYSLFFRILYNATYLDPRMSEKALALLSQTDFTKGLSGGIPNNITIAQKFGEFTAKTTDGSVIKRELHNCGLVYYPNHPYLICVMTKGKDFSSLENVISTISGKIFQYTEQMYGN